MGNVGAALSSVCCSVMGGFVVYRSDVKLRVRDRRLVACSLLAKALTVVYVVNYELLSNQSILLLERPQVASNPFIRAPTPNAQLPTWCTGNIDGYSLTRTANRFPSAFIDQVASSTLSAVMTISDTSCISNYTWSDIVLSDKNSIFITTMLYDRITPANGGALQYSNFRYVPLDEESMEVHMQSWWATDDTAQPAQGGPAVCIESVPAGTTVRQVQGVDCDHPIARSADVSTYLTLADWLRLVGVQSLTQENTLYFGRPFAPDTTHPKHRTTGVAVEVTLDYDPAAGSSIANWAVRASDMTTKSRIIVKARPVHGLWVNGPPLASVKTDTELRETLRTGVRINFSAGGGIPSFNYSETFTAVARMVVVYVLLKMAVDVLAFHVLAEADIYRAWRERTIDKESASRGVLPTEATLLEMHSHGRGSRSSSAAAGGGGLTRGKSGSQTGPSRSSSSAATPASITAQKSSRHVGGRVKGADDADFAFAEKVEADRRSNKINRSAGQTARPILGGGGGSFLGASSPTVGGGAGAVATPGAVIMSTAGNSSVRNRATSRAPGPMNPSMPAPGASGGGAHDPAVGERVEQLERKLEQLESMVYGYIASTTRTLQTLTADVNAHERLLRQVEGRPDAARDASGDRRSRRNGNRAAGDSSDSDAESVRLVYSPGDQAPVSVSDLGLTQVDSPSRPRHSLVPTSSQQRMTLGK